MRLLGLQTLNILEFIVSFANGASFDFTLHFKAKRDVSFLLRVRNRPFNNEEVFEYDTRNEIGSSAYNHSKLTTFLIHGYMEDCRSRHHLKLSK